MRATESHHPCHLVFVKTPICSLVLRSEAKKVELEVLAKDFEAPGVRQSRKLCICTWLRIFQVCALPHDE